MSTANTLLPPITVQSVPLEESVRWPEMGELLKEGTKGEHNKGRENRVLASSGHKEGLHFHPIHDHIRIISHLLPFVAVVDVHPS